jgi:mycofactocin biosynthetic radical S-adenosylmethionine protein MftC
MKHPAFIQFHPTLRCNQKCGFCFNGNISDPGSYRDMDKHEAFQLVDMAVKYGISEIDILGGEPLLVPWIKDFISYAMGLKLAVNISTNGSLLAPVIDLAETGADALNIGFSILGFSETHNALTGSDNFSKAISGIKRLASDGKGPIVKSVLMRENKDEISGLVDYLTELGVERYFLLHEDMIGRQDYQALSFPEYYAFYSELKKEKDGKPDIGFVAASGFYKHGAYSKFRCDAGITKIAVMPDGSAFPCNLFAGLGKFLLGNIFRDGIEKIWHNRILEFFRGYKRDNLCGRKDCAHYTTCTGGCPAHCYYYYGTIDAVDPRCREFAIDPDKKSYGPHRQPHHPPDLNKMKKKAII